MLLQALMRMGPGNLEEVALRERTWHPREDYL